MGHCGRCHSFAAAPLSRTREEDSAPEVGRSGTCAQLQWPSRSRVKRTPCHIASRKPVPSKLTRKWKLSRADGLVSVVLGVDVVQRPRGGRVDFRAFGLRAVLDVLKQTKDGSALPVLLLFGITQKKRRHAHWVCRSARWSCLAGGDGFWASSKSLRSAVRWWWGGASAGFRLDTVTCGSGCAGSAMPFLALFATLRPTLLGVSVRVRVEKWVFESHAVPTFRRSVVVSRRAWTPESEQRAS